LENSDLTRFSFSSQKSKIINDFHIDELTSYLNLV
jgi:hypothetical protein